MSFAAERREARERALGLLYEAEIKGVDPVQVLAELPVPADPYADALVRAVSAGQDRIDTLIADNLRGWTLARLAALDRAALRMGIAELATRPDVPTAVVLAETVELASRFGTDGSGRFVNGLLATAAREVRSDEVAAVGARAGAHDAAAAGTRLVDAVVLDLDGVLRHWDPEGIPTAEATLDLPPGTIGDAAFEPDRLARAMDGRLAFEGWAAEIGETVARDHPVAAESVALAFADMPWRIDLDVLDVVRALRRGGVPVAILSNASTRLQRELADAGLTGEVDLVVSSADIGVAKPDPAAFRHVADALGVPVERCAFTDDTAVNVAAAAALGMRTELHRDVPGLRRFLGSLGLDAGAPDG